VVRGKNIISGDLSRVGNIIKKSKVNSRGFGVVTETGRGVGVDNIDSIIYTEVVNNSTDRTGVVAAFQRG
jgi:hypothetical protein